MTMKFHKLVLLGGFGLAVLSFDAGAQAKKGAPKFGHASGGEVENGDAHKAAMMSKPVMSLGSGDQDAIRKDVGSSLKSSISQGIELIERHNKRLKNKGKVPSALRCLNDNMDAIVKAGMLSVDWRSADAEKNSLSGAEFKRVLEKISAGFVEEETYVE